MNVQGGDSCSTVNLEETPVSKVGAKRLTDRIESLDALRDEIGDASITKPAKMVRVKIEPKEMRLMHNVDRNCTRN